MRSQDEIFGITCDSTHANEQLRTFGLDILGGCTFDNSLYYQPDALKQEVQLHAFFIAIEKRAGVNALGSHNHRVKGIAHELGVSR